MSAFKAAIENRDIRRLGVDCSVEIRAITLSSICRLGMG
jgi:hypothetical protein